MYIMYKMYNLYKIYISILVSIYILFKKQKKNVNEQCEHEIDTVRKYTK